MKALYLRGGIRPADTGDIFWCASVAFNTLMLLYVITEAWFSARN